MSYPSTADAIPHVSDGVTNAAAAVVDVWIDAINAGQTYVGLSGDVAASSGSLTSQVKYLLAAPGGITRATTAPLSPATNDLWIETDLTTRPLSIFYSAAWHLVGANAVTLQNVTVHTAAPTNGQVLTYDSANTRWAPATGGMVSPLGTVGDLIVGGTGGTPTALTAGSAGQVLGISAGVPAWTTPLFVSDPAGAPIGAVLVKNGAGAWAYAAPTTSGYVLTDNGVGAAPTFQVIPVSSPGTGITTPAGVRVGDLVQYNELGAWVSIHPGAAGQYLTAHGDNNIAGSKLTWTTPTGSYTNPMTTPGDMTYADTGGAPLRLPIGTTARILQVVAGAPAWASLGGQVVPTYFDWTYQGSAPSTPAASTGRTYWKTDGKYYGKNAAGTEYDLTAQPAAGSKHVIEDEGTPLTARTNLNFVGTGVTATDDTGNDATVVTIPTLPWSRRLAFA